MINYQGDGPGFSSPEAEDAAAVPQDPDAELMLENSLLKYSHFYIF